MYTYMYPANLKEKAKIGVWEIKDVVISIILIILSFIIFTNTGAMIPLVLSATYIVLSATVQDISIKNYIKYIIRFCITQVQYFEWGLY